jgi:predicted transposase YdaD
MMKRFDSAMKESVDLHPEAWASYIGVKPTGTLRVIDSNVSTVTSETDKVFLDDGPDPYLIHFEMQSSVDLTLPRRLYRYNGLLDLRHDLRVLAVAVLLRPEADAEEINGVLALDLPDRSPVVRFYYRVVRAWNVPLDSILGGYPSILPLAPLSDIPVAEVPAVIRLVDDRLKTETDLSLAVKIMELTLVLAGLRLSGEEVEETQGSLYAMSLITESSYVQYLLNKGREEGLQVGREEGLQEGREEGLQYGQISEARRILLRLATARFGEPDESTLRTLESIDDLDRLERITDRILAASSWVELIATE